MAETTLRDRALAVVREVREHELFNVVTDETWARYIEKALHVQETACCKGLAPVWECRCEQDRTG